MWIEVGTLSDKKKAKLIKQLNSAYEKKKIAKIEQAIPMIMSWLDEGESEANLALYVLSFVLEEFPEFAEPSLWEPIGHFLEKGTLKQRLNAGIILGMILQRLWEEEKINSSISLTEQFLVAFTDAHPEVRQNVSQFIKELPSELETQLIPHLPAFLELLKTESNMEILRILTDFMGKIQEKMFLNMLIPYIKELTLIYDNSNIPDKNDLILSLIEKEIPDLSKRKEKKWKKKDIINAIHKRNPMMRNYSLKDLAKQENISKEEANEYLIEQYDEDLEYLFEFIDKKNTEITFIEKEPLIKFFDKDKPITMDEIISVFKKGHIDTPEKVTALIKNLVGDYLIKGFIAPTDFFPHAYLLQQLRRKLQQKGFLKIEEFTEIVDEPYLRKILDQVIKKDQLEGIFDLDRKVFYNMKFLLKEIQEIAAKQNIVDFTPYKDKFTYEDYKKLEAYCEKEFLTTHHEGDLWLTKLGKTRIATALHKTEQIGIFDLEEFADKLDIPQQIVWKNVRSFFDKKNGFWNKDQTKFYFAKYVKLQINKIQNQSDPDKRESMINRLSQEMQIPKEDIEQKVNAKLNQIGEKLKQKDSFEIAPLLRDLQMDYSEFMEFLNSLDKKYLIVAGKIIFSEELIQHEIDSLDKYLIKSAKQNSVLNVKDLARKRKCSESLLLERLNSLIEDGKIRGVWREPQKTFLLERGIKDLMLKSKDYIDLSSIIEGRQLDEKEQQYIISLFKELMEKGRLKGIFDEEHLVFQSQDFVNDLNFEEYQDRFMDQMSPILEDLERAYNFLRDILVETDLTPADLDDLQNTIDDIIKKIFNYEPFIQRYINNANYHLRKQANLRDKRTKGKDKRRRSTRKNRTDEQDSDIFPRFEENELIKGLIEDFQNWKTIIFEIEKRAGEIAFTKKKLKNNPDDEELNQKLHGIFEYLGFE